MSTEYEIVRFYHHYTGGRAGRKAKIIMRNVSLEEAQEHCSREDTHKVMYINERRHVKWFDGYRKM